MSENVIQFPKKYAGPSLPDPVMLQANLAALKEEEFEIVVEMISSALVDTLEATGFYVTGETDKIKDVCFLLEAVRSLLAKDFSLDHPFHDLAENCFTVKDNGVFFNNPTFDHVKKDEINLSD